MQRLKLPLSLCPGVPVHCRRLIPFALLFLALAGGSVNALINPDFTPVHLTQQSDVILYLRVHAGDEDGLMRAEILDSVKGRPGEADMMLKADETVRGVIVNQIFRDTEHLPGMVFLSGGDEETGENVSFGHLTLDGTWFGVELGDESDIWFLDADIMDMKAVWDGRVDMLKGCVELIRKMPVPDIPVAVGAQWESRERIGDTGGAVRSLQAVRLDRHTSWTLVVVAEDGDMFFTYDSETGAFRDVTGELGVSTASEAMELSDINGNGRMDILSLRDGALRAFLQSENGVFPEEADSTVAVEDGCFAVEAVEFGPGGSPCLIISTADWPLAVQWNAEKGSLTEPRPLIDHAGDFPGAEFGAARNCVISDFTGNALPDVLQPFERGGLLYRGASDGTFEPPVSVGRITSGRGWARARIGDFDGSGKMDVIIAGDSGHTIWLNRGEGEFISSNHLGEPDYIALRECSDAAVGELNSDGRLDFVLAYRGAMAHPFFNRGFSTFGFAISMDFSINDFFPESRTGQQALLMHDLTGCGAQELAMVLRDGSVWVLSSDTGDGRNLSLQAELPHEGDASGPVIVKAFDGVRALGARTMVRGREKAFFGKERPGPLTLNWQFPGHEPREAQIPVIRGPVRVVLGAEGIIPIE